MAARTFEDAFNLLCGTKIGGGIHRDVFTCKLHDDLVVKVEHDEDYRSFSNVFESRNWDDYAHYDAVARWLAPVKFLSPDGRILLQKRVIPAQPKDLPDKLPGFLTDVKWENFGMLEDRLVCCDYSTLIVNPKMKLRKAHWQ